MIFSKDYEIAIRQIPGKKGFDVYKAQYGGLLVPATLSKALVTTPLSRNTHYTMLPSRDFFMKNLGAIGTNVLNDKVLKLAERVKPVVKFYLTEEDLEQFVLRESQVELSLIHHPKFRRDFTPRKSHPEIVSYRHFVDMLERMNPVPIDYFV